MKTFQKPELTKSKMLIVEVLLQTENIILVAVAYRQSRATREVLQYSSDSAEVLPDSGLERQSNYKYFWNTQGLPFCWNTFFIHARLLVGSEGQTRVYMLFEILKKLWILNINTQMFIPCSSVRG